MGSLFAWQKPYLNLIQRAIDELKKSEDMDITLCMHTPQQNTLSHNELGNRIRQSSIMLVLTNPNAHGMLTTKFYEALGCDKPILCVPNDQGALQQLIQYTQAGIATEEIEQIKTFIRDKYNEWKQKGYTQQHNQHAIEFARETQCEKMEKLLHL